MEPNENTKTSKVNRIKVAIKERRPSGTGRRRQARRILNMWARLSLLGLAIAVLLMAAFCLAAKAIRPYRQIAREQQQYGDTERQIAALNQQNAVLNRRVGFLRTEEGVVSEARNIGYVRPGEIPIIIQGVPDRWTAPPAPAPKVDNSIGARLRSIWRRMTN